jgi:lipopolysaccharide transport system permease protein
MLVKREFSARYAGSTLGAFWNLVHPIVLIAIYVLVFSKIMASRMGTDASRLTYAVHLTSGIVPWFFFSEIISRSTTVLVENAGLLKKMAMPEEVLFLGIFITSAVVHGISMAALIILLAAAGVPLGPGVLLSFPAMLLLGVAGLGIGMLLAVMTLLVRDVGQFVQIALQLLFWSLPIVYFPDILPGTVREAIALNPFKGFFSLIQSLFGSPVAGFNPDAYWMMILLPFAAILIGTTFLRNHRSEILDTI